MKNLRLAVALALLGVTACSSLDSGTEKKKTKDDDAEEGDTGKKGDDKDSDGETITPGVVEDPAPEQSEAGETTCKGCPTGDAQEFELDLGDATSHTFTGTVKNAKGDGTFYVEGADGQQISGTIPTSSKGKYEVNVPLFCGEQTVKFVWSNDKGRYVTVTKVTTTCSEDEEAGLRVTLTWDKSGKDFELHLIQPGGKINDGFNDCTWTSCVDPMRPLDWGVKGDEEDNPKKDVDDKNEFGPENIVLRKPVKGTYTVLVEHWGGGSPEASGTLILNVKGKQTEPIAIKNLASKHVFQGATITFPSGEVKLLEKDYDCTKDWQDQKGCYAKIP